MRAEFEWKQSERLLFQLGKCRHVSWPWKNFSADERCALHELITKGLVKIHSKIGDGVSIQISEKGLQEIFINVL